MENKFKTYEEAEKKLNDFDSDFTSTTFCPLIKEKCKNSCVCFVESIVRYDKHEKDESKKYYVWKAYCGNKMFFSS